jgi:N-acetylmuramoyl-L-alanine amidase
MRWFALLAIAVVAVPVFAQETRVHRFPPEGPQDTRTDSFAVGVVGPADSVQTAREYVQSDDWLTLPPLNYDLPPYAEQALRGVRICLDPGHGGDMNQRGYKRGATGFRESVMNLEVAEAVRGWLEQGGAEVVMTRTDDTNPEGGSLEYRGRLADRENCQLFVSIHHNAFSRGSADYLTVWYHARPDVPTADTDLARWICTELNRCNRTPEQQHVGLMSDWLMYPSDPNDPHEGIGDALRLDTTRTIPSGFGVLRHARVPACLVECAFYTNRQEEMRLMDREYLRREGWGIFSGILEYLWAGIPKISFPENAPASYAGPRPEIRVALDDGMHEGWGKNNPPRIHFETLRVYIDDERAILTYRPLDAEIVATPPHDLAPGPHTVRVRVLNAWGNWSWPTQLEFTVR